MQSLRLLAFALIASVSAQSACETDITNAADDLVLAGKNVATAVKDCIGSNHTLCVFRIFHCTESARSPRLGAVPAGALLTSSLWSTT